MRFWDTSAIIPLLLEEPASTEVLAVLRDDPVQLVWCLTEVEIASAFARRQREGAFDEETGKSILAELRALQDRWQEIVALEQVRSRAIRILRIHSLGAADSLQLAAALVASDERPEGFSFVCLDARLREAARKEGFLVGP